MKAFWTKVLSVVKKTVKDIEDYLVEMYFVGLNGMASLVKRLSFGRFAGFGSMQALFTMAFMAMLLFMFMARMQPQMNVANAEIQSATGTAASDDNTKFTYGFLVWAIPLCIGLGIALALVSHSGGSGGKGR